MTNNVKSGIKCLGVALMGTVLAACTSSGDVRQPPSYAFMVDSDAYRVDCWEASPRELYVRYDAVDTFYYDDGSAKSREEFCGETPYGHIRR